MFLEQALLHVQSTKKPQMNFGADFESDNFLFIVTNAQAIFYR